jgi:hypothetical protein
MSPYLPNADGEPTLLPLPPMEQMHSKTRRIMKKSEEVWTKYRPDLDAANARGDSAEAKRIRSVIREELNKIDANK